MMTAYSLMKLPENNLPRVHQQVEASWQDAKGAWRDEIALEFEQSVYLPLVDALKNISDSYGRLQEEFTEFYDATEVVDFYKESEHVTKEFWRILMEE
jgi:hypothetical protein